MPSDIGPYGAQLMGFLSALELDHISISVYHPRPGAPQDIPALEALTERTAACERLARSFTRHFLTRPLTGAGRQMKAGVRA